MDTIYYLLTTPREGFRRIINNNPVSLFVFLLVLISTSLSISTKIISPFGMSLNYFGLFISVLTLIFLLTFKIIFVTLIFNYSAECFGGRASSGSAFLGFGFSFLPFIFSAPFIIISLLIDQPFKGMLCFLIFLFLSIWVLILQITAIREIYSLTAGRAFIAYISPILIGFFLFGAIFLSSIANVITKFAALFKSLPI